MECGGVRNFNFRYEIKKMSHFPTCDVEITCFLKFTPLNFFRKKVFFELFRTIGKTEGNGCKNLIF